MNQRSRIFWSLILINLMGFFIFSRVQTTKSRNGSTPFSPGSLSMRRRLLATCCGASYGAGPLSEAHPTASRNQTSPEPA